MDVTLASTVEVPGELLDAIGMMDEKVPLMDLGDVCKEALGPLALPALDDGLLPAGTSVGVIPFDSAVGRVGVRNGLSSDKPVGRGSAKCGETAHSTISLEIDTSAPEVAELRATSCTKISLGAYRERKAGCQEGSPKTEASGVRAIRRAGSKVTNSEDVGVQTESSADGKSLREVKLEATVDQLKVELRCLQRRYDELVGKQSASLPTRMGVDRKRSLLEKSAPESLSSGGDDSVAKARRGEARSSLEERESAFNRLASGMRYARRSHRGSASRFAEPQRSRIPVWAYQESSFPSSSQQFFGGGFQSQYR